MSDVFTKAKRSEIMAKIKGANTRPELLVRSVVPRMGYRFSLHRGDLPGKPDLVLPRHKKVIFVHGCFWHGHQGCSRATVPSTNARFWEGKISGNAARDRRNLRDLRKLGWRALTLWQCQIRRPEKVVRTIEKFMQS